MFGVINIVTKYARVEHALFGLRWLHKESRPQRDVWLDAKETNFNYFIDFFLLFIIVDSQLFIHELNDINLEAIIFC